jgi:hypothetical protein
LAERREMAEREGKALDGLGGVARRVWNLWEAGLGLDAIAARRHLSFQVVRYLVDTARDRLRRDLQRWRA